MSAIEAKIKRQRATIRRRQGSLEAALDERDKLVREALAAGVRPIQVAKLTGLHISRISQIRKGEV